MNPDKTRHLTGLLLMLAAALCWSLGGILVRSVERADGWEMVFWRSLFMAAFLAVIVAWRHGAATPRQLATMGWVRFGAGCALGATFFFFILSLERTTVANTQIILSLVPVTAALLGLAVLHERIPGRTWIAMAIAFAGVALMCWDSLAAAQGGGSAARTAAGLLLAFGVPIGMAVNIVLLRLAGGARDSIPTILVAGLVAMAAALPFALPFRASANDLMVLAIAGVFQVGMGSVLVTLATRYLRAAEIGLLAMLESVLSPFWVWIGIGERPTDLSIVGGVLVLAALAVDAALDLTRRRAVIEAPAAVR